MDAAKDWDPASDCAALAAEAIEDAAAAAEAEIDAAMD